MKQRVLDAIYKKIEEFPNDIHLQRQINLLNKASICTIHSFCLDVIRNNFYEIDTSANFRVGDSTEIELLKQEVLEDLFEQKYIENDSKFIELINSYTSYKGDEPLKELILNIYKYIQSTPFPEEWLKEKVEMFNIENKEKDFGNTIWGEILLNECIEELEQSKLKLETVKHNLDRYTELEKYSTTVAIDIEKIEEIIKRALIKDEKTWDAVYELANELKFDKWPIDKKATIDYKNDAKEIRDSVKKKISTLVNKILIYNSKEANEDIYSMYNVLNNLKDIVIEFSNKFAQAKKEKNIVDFNDIEHFALKILVKCENSKTVQTEVAKKYIEKFVEIDIDEYQDSNLVQEYILNSISNGNNMFMVGDVKQSIYKFRQARPELFLEKYDNWQLFGLNNEKTNGNIEDLETLKNGNKIQLFKNFRSRKNVLDITNMLFTDIMSKKLGDIDYTEEEYLNLGANFEEPTDSNIKDYAGITELHIIDCEAKESEEDELEEQDSTEENAQIVENTVIEAKFVANKIKELLNSNYMVYDRKKGYRKITYKDIAILLRATSVSAPIYERELANLNFPVFSDTSSEYIESADIQVILSLLKIIDNPLQDIALITVLRSPIANFTDNELVEIRLTDKTEKYFYNTLIKSKVSVSEELRKKIDMFLEQLERWRNEEKYKPLDELIWQIYNDTNYYNYVGLLQNGELRQANLKMLFEKAKQYESASFKGLFNFINFIDRLKTSSGDMQSAKIIGENENVIRIMSIHKSKGLEFPVVFLCGTGKKFNLQDLNDTILMHQDLGFGPKYINCERRIEYNTLAKEALRIKSKRETVSEEMRVLYVALTRAKEKLIITGITKELEKSLKEKEELLKLQEDEDKINVGILKKYNSYLDWLELVYINNKEKMKDVMKLVEHSYKEVSIEEQMTEIPEGNIVDKLKSVKVDKEQLEEISKQLEWKYKYEKSSKIPTKTSVTKIKEMENEANFDFNEYLKKTTEGNENFSESSNEYKKELKAPKFMNEEENITSARKGSLMHLCIQKLDESKEYSLKDIQELVNNLEQKEIITKKEAESINVNKLEKYTKSSLWNELKNAKKVYKEEPFYINVPASKIYKDEELEENILVQGIIDLYYIDKDDKIVLVDYKTDYVEKGKEQSLIDKYKVQLNLYKEALEKALNKKVDKVIIYSIWLQKEIEIKKDVK